MSRPVAAASDKPVINLKVVMDVVDATPALSDADAKTLRKNPKTRKISAIIRMLTNLPFKTSAGDW